MTTGQPHNQALDEETTGELRRYVALLLQANSQVRIVGPRDETTLWDDQIVSSLSLLPLLPERGCVIDVGTGGGIPGAVLAICRRDLDFTLLDSQSRKTRALGAIVDALGLANAHVVCARSEEHAAERRESYDCAVVCAVSDAGVVAEYLSPLVRVGGTLLAMKGSSAAEEVAPMAGRWGEIGLSEPQLHPYRQGDHTNHVVVWEKVSPCPAKYPRRPGRAEKVPWWRR